MTLESDAALIAAGSWLRSKTIVNAFDEAVGGIVCDAVVRQQVDDETGEVSDITLYRVRDCNDPAPLRYRILPGDDVNPGEAWPASTYDIARLVRRICFEIGKAKSRTTRAARELTNEERVALYDAIAALVAIS